MISEFSALMKDGSMDELRRLEDSGFPLKGWIMEPRPRFELGTLAFSDFGYQGNALGCKASTRLSHRGCGVRSECLLIKFRLSEIVHFHNTILTFEGFEMTGT